MKKTVSVAGSLFCLLASLVVSQTAFSQTKMSGTVKCGKDTVQQMVEVGDRPGHSFGVSQGNCSWTKPFKIAGIASKEGVGTNRIEANGDVATVMGIYVDTMENGDKAIYHDQATSTTKDGKVQITGHKWQLVGGTGKLKGVKGQGTCKVTTSDDGSSEYKCSGEYTMAK